MGMLAPEQFGDLIAALVDAYPVRVDFAQMLRVRLGKSLDALASTGALEADIFRVIETAEAQGWTLRLINAARESRPGNDKIVACAQPFKLVSTNTGGAELEQIIKTGNGFLDVATWRTALGEAEPRICRVEVGLNSGATGYGTGFLIGESTVITNYHVVEPLFKQQAAPEALTLRFDYKHLADGTTLNQGTPYQIERAGWCIAYSPYSPADLPGAAPGQLPGEDELDFVLLKVRGKPALDRVGKANSETEAPRRGSFQLPASAPTLQPGAPLLILQHPQADYLKLAIDTQAGLEHNANHTRLRYTTNTLPGSSGSPCFSINWELVALHHAGDPNYGHLGRAAYNQGIPLNAILRFLTNKGLPF